VAVAKERDEHPVDQVLLADDQARHVGFELLELF
jgi:hypothetical protein